jgi:DNA-binding LacI/PurR family transcriptional regulator
LKNPVTKRPTSFSQPAYRKVEEDLRARIRNGHWTPGGMLPGRKALASEYGVNLETVQRGIKRLVDEGILVVDSRRGTYVSRDQTVTGTPLAPLPEVQVDAPRRPKIGFRIVGVAGYVDITNVDWIASPVNATALAAMEDAAADLGMVCRAVNMCGRDTGVTLTAVDAAVALAKSGVAGMALMIGHDRPNAAVIADLMETALPLVLVSLEEERWPIPTVCYDNRDAGQLGARHLLEQGCENLLYISYSPDKWSLDRLTGAREALLLAGRPVEGIRDVIGNVAVVGDEWMDRVQCLKEFALGCIDSGVPVDGVIAGNDLMAAAFMEAAKQRGMMAGRDYAIIGFDDHARSRFLGLTSLKPPIEEMGREAMRLLAAALDGQQLSRRIGLHSKLIVRESSLIGAAAHSKENKDG